VIGGDGGSPTGLIAAAIILVALAIFSAPAYAASTRAEYVAQVEPICHAAQKPTFKAYGALFKGLSKAGLVGDQPEISRKTRRISARLLGTFYLRISNVYASTTAQISAVLPAPGDEAAVTRRLDGRNQAATLGAQAGRAAKHQKVRRAARLVNNAASLGDEAAMTSPPTASGSACCPSARAKVISHPGTASRE
jgi:hypothetical protein